MRRTPRLSRRTLLRAAGAAIALPWLEAMTPSTPARRFAAASERTAPQRLLFYFMPNGMHMPAWTPTAAGRDYALPPTLAPLAPFREQLVVLTGMSNRAGYDDVAGDHARGTAAFLTARRPTQSESELDLGISVDQIAANAIGGNTRFASLQLGLEPGGSTGVCDSGYSCAYSHNISWADADTPLPKMVSPYQVFARLFGTNNAALDAAALERRRQYRASVLDDVASQASELGATLGAADRAKLDEYLTAVREVELRMGAFDDPDDACGPLDLPVGLMGDADAHARIMNELMVMALRCDQTRVVSFMLGNGGSLRVYAFLGIVGMHHEISHHQQREANLAALQKINLWEMQIFADLVDRMRNSVEADGTTLLDNTLIYLGSEIGDGDAHNHDHIPTLLCGGGGGLVRHGQHIVYDERPTARLFVSMLNAVGVPTRSFGMDGDGPLDGLG